MATCLVVDDDEAQRMLTRMVVEGTGLFGSVWEAADGREAIFQTRSRQPDLVLLDLSMPVLDGIQALPGLRAACPTSLIIVCSMVRDPAKLRAATLAGADGFIDKSLAVDPFGEAVKALVLGTRRPSRPRRRAPATHLQQRN